MWSLSGSENFLVDTVVEAEESDALWLIQLQRDP